MRVEAHFRTNSPNAEEIRTFEVNRVSAIHAEVTVERLVQGEPYFLYAQAVLPKESE